MKRKFLKLIVTLLGIYLVACSANDNIKVNKDRMKSDEYNLIVATDLHYISPSLTDHGEYFTRLVENADGKYMIFCEEIVDAFIEEVIDQHPSALILSGDITFNGAKLSHQDLAKKLKKIEDEGISVLVLPGNHDLNNKMAASFRGNSYQLVESVDSSEFASIYEKFGVNSIIEKDLNSLSYVAEIDPNLWIIMVDVNTKENRNRVSKETMNWIESQLQKARNQGIRVLSVTHQNILRHNSMFYDGFVIENCDELAKLYEKYDVILNLSGHMHIQHIEKVSELNEIATSSLMVSPNQYGIITISQEGIEYHTKPVDVETWAKNNNRDDLLNFAEDSYDFFWKSSYNQSNQATMVDEEHEQLAQFMAQVNCAYFGGYLNEIEWNDKLIEKIQSQDSFFSMYIRTIAEEKEENHQKYKIEYKK